MERLSETQINLIRTLSNKKLSLRKIQQKTKIPLSTLQYRLNKNKKVKRERQIKIPSSEFIKGEIIGSFAGDGNYYHDQNGRCSKHYVRYSLSYRDDKNYADYLSLVFKNIGLNVNIYIKLYKGKPSAFELRVCSLNFIRFIKEYVIWKNKKTYSIQLRKDIKLSKNFLLGFARGIMDTDGFVESHGVACGVVSKKLINDLKKIFSIIQIKPKITVKKREGKRKNLYLLRVSKKYLGTYNEYIGFSNLRKKKRLIEIIHK